MIRVKYFRSRRLLRELPYRVQKKYEKTVGDPTAFIVTYYHITDACTTLDLHTKGPRLG